MAAEIPPAVREAVDRTLEEVRSQLPRARWVPERNYHLTLRFFGEIDDEERQRFESDLETVFARHEPFSLHLGASGVFPEGRPARVAWIGLANSGALISLAGDVRAATGPHRGEEDRRGEGRFSPHLTVARCRPPWRRPAVRRWIDAVPGPVGEPFDVSRGVMMRSRLEPGGARYDVVRAFPLGGS